MVNNYNYYTEVYKDVENYIKENHRPIREYGATTDDIFENLIDELWDVDSVTGNGPDGYDSEKKCEEYICRNLELLFSAIDDFDFDISYKNIHKPNLAIRLDSIIRLYVLHQAIWDYLGDNLEDD